MQSALPEAGAPHPMGRRLAWKQERAGPLPGRILFNNLLNIIKDTSAILVLLQKIIIRNY